MRWAVNFGYFEFYIVDRSKEVSCNGLNGNTVEQNRPETKLLRIVTGSDTTDYPIHFVEKPGWKTG